MARIVGTEDDDDFAGTNGNDKMFGLGGDDDLFGASGRDVLWGGDGDDALSPGRGNDRVYGEDGDDRMTLYAGKDFLDGGAGFDTIDLYWALEKVNFKLADGRAKFMVDFGKVDTKFTNFENVNGSLHDDRIIGDWQDNYLFGRAGNDTLRGSGGNDLLNGDIGDDTISGGGGSDRIVVSDGRDTLDGGRGDDTLDFYNVMKGVDFALTDAMINVIVYGGRATITFRNFETVYATGYDDHVRGDAARNYLYGAAGNDILSGLDGDDLLQGSYGNDTLIGGAGADTFLLGEWPSADNLDTVDDFDVAQDAIALAQYVFGDLVGTGPVSQHGVWLFQQMQANQFQAGPGNAALTADVRVIYDSTTGILHYDEDGNGAGSPEELFRLDAGLAITADALFIAM